MLNGIPTKPHYNLTEFASIIGVSYSTAKRMACAGAVPRVQLMAPGQKLVPHSEVQRVLRKLGAQS